jgi:diguanylate cyclase (GGDEF)-like protein/PAS domain S-box-containing protein
MDKVKYSGSIQKKLLKIILLITSLTYLIAYSIFAIWYIHNQEKEKKQLAFTISHVLGQDFAKLILLKDVSTAADITTKLRSFNSIDSITIYTKDNTAIYRYNKTKSPENSKKLLTFHIPATYAGTDLGNVVFNIYIETLQDLVLKDLPLLLLLYILMIVTAYFLAKYYALKFTKPIVRLVDFLEQIDLTQSRYKEISITQNNEYGKLYQEVNLMLQRIQEATKEQKIAAVAFNTEDAIIITDQDKKVIKVNQAFTNMTQYVLEDIQGDLPPVLQYNKESEIYQEILKDLETKGYWSGEIKNQKKNKTLFCEKLVIQKVVDDTDQTTHYVLSFTDLTKQKETEKKLHYLMQYDPLTGLANKELFVKSMQAKIDKDTSTDWHLLFCIDIKNFKIINDVYGHEYGDLVLKEIAQRLQKEFKESDFIAKIGIDEFILCYRNINSDREKGIAFSKTTAEYIITIINQEYTIKDKSINIISRVGINFYNNTIKDANIILKQADAALQLAKEQDIPFAYFDKEIEKSNLQHIDLYSELLDAIKNKEFVLYYQLQYNDKKHIIGAEALIRWIHPTKGIIPPNSFIPIAEKTGLILPIGSWVVEESCRQLAKWKQNPKTAHWVLAVNVSAKQFEQENFVSDIIENVEKNDIAYKNLKIELVESMLVNNMHDVIQKMKALKHLNIALAMDDFGTGYSSLSYLKNLPLSQIKIDQSFVMNMLNNNKDKAIVKSIIELSHGFEMDIIAEGVETEEDFELLRSLGCYKYQGYYFARPQSITYIDQLIQTL